MFTKAFALDALERAIKSVAYTMLALIGADQVDFLKLDYAHMLGVSLTAAVVSILGSIVSSGVGSRGTASLTPDVKYNGNTP